MSKKGRTSEDVLKPYGILFKSKTLSPDKLMELNRQSGLLAKYLLDFRNTLTREDNRYLENPYTDRHTTLIPSPTIQEERNQHAKEEYRKNFDIANCEAKVDLAYAIRKAAQAIVSEEENRWTNIIVHLLFGQLHKAALELERPNCYRSIEDAIGKIRTDCDRLWTLGSLVLKEHAQLLDEKLKVTKPKPDLCLSFHAYSQDYEDGGPMHADSYIHNFGRDSLVQLYEQNRKVTFKPYSSPFVRFYKSDRQYCDQSCFPWAICEWKKHINPKKPHDSGGKVLNVQIAKAGAVAATIFANITAARHGKPILDNIRPVVCFSFLGPRVKVYVVFINEISPSGRYKYVQCIWRGKLTNVVHNRELCWIIERLHRWAINHLRPWLSSCIDAWNMHKCSGKECVLHSSNQSMQPQSIIGELVKPRTTTKEEDELEEGELDDDEVDDDEMDDDEENDDEGNDDEENDDEENDDEENDDEENDDEENDDEENDDEEDDDEEDEESFEDDEQEDEVVEDAVRQIKKANTSEARAARDSSKTEADERWEPQKLKRQSTAASMMSAAAKLFKGKRNARRD